MGGRLLFDMAVMIMAPLLGLCQNLLDCTVMKVIHGVLENEESERFGSESDRVSHLCCSFKAKIFADPGRQLTCPQTFGNLHGSRRTPSEQKGN